MQYGRDIAVIFDGTFEGFLNIIYNHYYEKLVPSYICDNNARQCTIDSIELYVYTDYEKAFKVRKALYEKVSFQFESNVYGAFLCKEIKNKYMDLYNYILFGFKVGKEVDKYEQIDFCLNIHKLSNYTYKEAHSLYGFCRFEETTFGIFYCKISPVNNVLGILAEYFSDKYEKCIIHDTKRNLVAICSGNHYEIKYTENKPIINYTDDEYNYKNLWYTFHNSISIKERENKNLQMSKLAIRYRKNMSEFNK